MEDHYAETKATSERAERLANLLMLSYEPMLAWNLDGSIDFWNAGAERLYGFAPNEAVGRISHTLLQTKFPIEFTELRSKLRNERNWSGEFRPNSLHYCPYFLRYSFEDGSFNHIAMDRLQFGRH